MEFKVTIGENSRVARDSTLAAVCAEMTSVYGPIGLRVEPIKEPSSTAPSSPHTAPPARLVAVEAQPSLEGGTARCERDQALALASGFALPAPLFALGTRVNETGVENAGRSRLEWLEQPTIRDACGDLVERVQGEDRRDVAVELASLTMDDNGWLRSGRRTTPLTGRSFTSLVQRIGCGGAGYLQDGCWPELRAHNVRQQLQAVAVAEQQAVVEWGHQTAKVGFSKAGPEPQPQQVVLRTRNNPKMRGGRETFALVSDRYQTGFGVDVVAKGIGSAIDETARGTVDYDGERLKVNAIWHSDVIPTDYRAGEVFKAGVVIRADDTGAGGVSISACLWRNLCLNLIVIGTSEQKIAALRHIGDLGRIKAAFEAAFAMALSKVAGFRTAWGYATHENVIASVHDLYPETKPMTLEELIPGIFSAVIDREKVPVRARRKDVVPMLVEKFQKDEIDRHAGFTRAAVVNAFSRFAHEEVQDPFHQEELERAAGALLFPKAGRRTLEPLPWAPWSS